MTSEEREKRQILLRKIAAVLRYFVRNRQSHRMMARMYCPDEDINWMSAPFRKNCHNLDPRCVDLWTKIVRRHKHRMKKNRDMGAETEKTKRRAIRSKAVNPTTKRVMATEYAAKASIEGTVRKILEDKEFFGKFYYERTVCHRVDHLFISIEPDPEKRYKRLVRIFRQRHTEKDILWVNIMWDYISKKRYKLLSDKIKNSVKGNDANLDSF